MTHTIIGGFVQNHEKNLWVEHFFKCSIVHVQAFGLVDISLNCCVICAG